MYTRSARNRLVTMCQNQGQALYTRRARIRIVATKLNMPNPFFALALGLCTQANSYQEKWRQAPLRSTLRDFVSRAHTVVVLDKNQKRTDREGHNPARHLSFESHLKAGTIGAVEILRARLVETLGVRHRQRPSVADNIVLVRVLRDSAVNCLCPLR